MIRKTDLGDGARLLQPDFGLLQVCGWVKYKFGISLDIEEIRSMALAEIKQLVRTRAEAAYDEKEIEFPVLAGLYHFTFATRPGPNVTTRRGWRRGPRIASAFPWTLRISRTNSGMKSRSI